MIDLPGFILPFCLALLSPPKTDTIRTELKPIKFETKTVWVDINCEIIKKQNSSVLEEDGVYYRYETNCGYLIDSKESYRIGDAIIIKKQIIKK